MVLYYAVLSIPLCVVGSAYFEDNWKVWNLGKGYGAIDFLLLILVGLTGYMGQWLTNLGLQAETAATATLASSTQLVWTYLFEQMFLHEPLNLWSLSGTGLILADMVVVAISKMVEANAAAKKMTQEQVGLLMDIEQQPFYHTTTSSPEDDSESSSMVSY